MLPRNEGGVVELRIYRVQGLRVVGTSVFPAVPQGNPQSLVYTVAREAADYRIP
jgi:choline dehydrogenase-like flavoprotein